MRPCPTCIAQAAATSMPPAPSSLQEKEATPHPYQPGDLTSMPSAHAANWFAATMIFFIYYRRSLWIMLPAAMLVGFSRVYNGVHFPSDVLAGAILGAGYAACGVWSLDALWHWAGRNWFPLWWRRMPSLLNPTVRAESEETEEAPSALGAPHSSVDQHWLRLGYIWIALGLLARLVYIASGTIQLSEDEAYQWLWSKHLALSYYSKPPLIAYTQFLGTLMWGDTAFGVRFFSPVIAAVIGLLMLRFFAREVNARAGFFLLLIITATPLMSVGAVLMTIDPLSVLFWTAAMLAGWRAVQAGRHDPAMALGGPVDGPGVPEQIHRAVPVAVLGRLLRPLASGAQTPAPPGAVLGRAGQCPVRPAGADLELPAPVDHGHPCGRRRGARQRVEADA